MAFAVSAVAAAIAAPTIASVLGAVAAVGAATSVVGIVTGKQNLVKIGGELGLVGGLGSLAAGALSSTAAGVSDLTGEAAAGAGASDITSEAGVAEGAAAAPYSDVAGEKFAIGQGLDAAGSGFAAGAGADGATAANGALLAGTSQSAAPIASGVGGASAPAGALQTGANSVAIDGSLDGAPGAGLAQPVTDASPATVGQPQTLSDSALNDAYSDVSGEKYAISKGMGAAGDGFAQSPLDKVRNALGDSWGKLSPLAQAEIVKSALAIPGGIQNQRNMQAQLDIARQRTNQTSHGSEVPTFGIIANARKG